MVGTRVGGVPELLTARNGVLVDPESPEALARGLRCALGRRWDPGDLRSTVRLLSWGPFGAALHEALRTAECPPGIRG